MSLQKIGFIGLGLIGGSIAKKLHALHPELTIIATAHHAETVAEAYKEHLIINNTPCELKDFADCDYIFLCTPTKKNIEYLQQLKDVISPDCIITDVGSVKTEIHREVIRLGLEANFIGGHPMAGSEKTGLSNASETLLENAYYIITPTTKSPSPAVEELTGLVRSLGAIPLVLGYEQHDYATAAISHLPHVIAYSLVNLVRESDDENEIMKTIAAGGFKDITRIASSSPVMWENICLSNQEQILKLTDCYIHALQNIRSSVADAKSDDIISFFQSAKDYRDSITTPVRGSLQKNYSVYCDLVDEAGAIATLATIMASHNISIKNIGILHNREYEDGVLQIEFYEEDALEKAVKLMEDNHYVVHRR